MNRAVYEVWFAPTLLAQQAFGWKHKLKRVYDNRDDADEFAWFEWVDDPARDSEFYSIIVIRIEQ